MSWAQRRRTTYLAGIAVFIIVFIVLPLLYYFYKPPTCFDGKQNQDEKGTDCGGVCTLLCKESYSDARLVWDPRFSRVSSSGVYNLLAYLENPNLDAGADNVIYNFKVYDKDSILLAERTGKTSIPANKNFVIFEEGIDVKDKTPKRVSFEILNENQINWRKVESKEGFLFTLSKSILNEDTKPRILATVENRSLKPIRDIEFAVIAYDSLDNAIAFSRTRVDEIPPKSSQNITYTWPKPFSGKTYKIEIIPKVLE